MHASKCSELMTTNLACCLAEDTVDKAARSMKTENVGSLPVVDSLKGKQLIGIVTDRDLAIKVVAEGLDPSSTRVSQVMSTGMVTCKTGDDWQIALNLMAEHQLRRIPVVDKQGCVAGIIAQADVATRINEPEQTARVLEEISQG
jgi:CBS domain-containing protein